MSAITVRAKRLIHLRIFCAIFPADVHDAYSADPNSGCQAASPLQKPVARTCPIGPRLFVPASARQFGSLSRPHGMRVNWSRVRVTASVPLRLLHVRDRGFAEIP
jgi:hypothetical protein